MTQTTLTSLFRLPATAWTKSAAALLLAAGFVFSPMQGADPALAQGAAGLAAGAPVLGLVQAERFLDAD